jgi:hypothetical protein
LVKKSLYPKEENNVPIAVSKRNERSHAKETIVAYKPSLKNDAVTILSPIVDGSDLETEVIREVSQRN